MSQLSTIFFNIFSYMKVDLMRFTSYERMLYSMVIPNMYHAPLKLGGYKKKQDNYHIQFYVLIGSKHPFALRYTCLINPCLPVEYTLAIIQCFGIPITKPTEDQSACIAKGSATILLVISKWSENPIIQKLVESLLRPLWVTISN